MRDEKVRRNMVPIATVTITSALMTATQMLLAYVRSGPSGVTASVPNVLYPAGMLMAAAVVLVFFGRTDHPVLSQFTAAIVIYAVAILPFAVAALGFPLGSTARTTLADMAYTSVALAVTSMLMCAGIRAAIYVRSRLDDATRKEPGQDGK